VQEPGVGHHRELLTEVLKDRCLPPRSAGACATRTFGNTRLAHEDDDSSLSRCDFLSCSRCLTFQVRIGRSLRSRAWPVGRSTLQPIRRNARHTEGIDRRVPKRSWISATMHDSVDISARCPAASAPCLSSPYSSFRCASVSQDLPPGRPTRETRSGPAPASARSQRINDRRNTRSWRATSAGFTPCASMRVSLTRRRFKSFSASLIECHSSAQLSTIMLTVGGLN